MEVSEDSSVQTKSSSEHALHQALISDNGDVDRDISDGNRAEAKLGLPEPRASSDADSDSTAFDLALREEFARLVLKESEGSPKSDSKAKIEEGIGERSGNDGVDESDRELKGNEREEFPEDSIEDDRGSEEKNKEEESNLVAEKLGNEVALKIEGVTVEDHEVKNASHESEENRDERSGPESFQYPAGLAAEGLGNPSVISEGNEEAPKIEGESEEEDHEVKNGIDEPENRDERSGLDIFQYPVRPEDEGLGNWSESNEEALKIEDESMDEDHEVKNGDHETEKRAERYVPKRFQYPVRPEAEDCAYYLRTWTCKFGLHCKFNHPARRKPGQQPGKERVRLKETEDTSEKPYRLSEPLMQSDPLRQSEPSRQQECKYYLRSGGCKYGKSCKNLHDPRAKVAPALVPAFDYNFLGLPLRMGEKECMFYMRTGSCKYGAHCRFNHPDPTDETGSENPTGYNNAPVPLQGGSQLTTGPSWSSPRSMNETPPAPFVPLMPPLSQGPPSQNSDWNGYQAPVYHPPERNMPPPSSPYTMNNHHSSQNQAEHYPERPGQPDCSFFLKTGDCKFRYNCKYNHPKNRGSIFTPCTLSDKGLPLRPDQNICSHYSRYGICKYGPACKYDHSPLAPNLTLSGGENHPMFGGLSAAMEGAGMARSGSRNEIAIQL